jgi:hypothetical protein
MNGQSEQGESKTASESVTTPAPKIPWWKDHLPAKTVKPTPSGDKRTTPLAPSQPAALSTPDTSSQPTVLHEYIPILLGLAGILVCVFVVVVVTADRPKSDYGKSESSNSRGSKITAENYLRIKNGMNHSDVTIILGQPLEKKGEYPALRIWKWKEGAKEITVVIDENGSVAGKTQIGLD